MCSGSAELVRDIPFHSIPSPPLPFPPSKQIRNSRRRGKNLILTLFITPQNSKSPNPLPNQRSLSPDDVPPVLPPTITASHLRTPTETRPLLRIPLNRARRQDAGSAAQLPVTTPYNNTSVGSAAGAGALAHRYGSRQEHRR